MALKTGEPGRKKHALTEPIVRIIREAFSHSDRNLQTTLGPSEIGLDCDRQLAYKLAGTNQDDGHNDPLAAIIGTAVHAWLADVFRGAGPEWIVEHRLELGTDVVPKGTADLFYTVTGSVIDWKVVGPTSFTKYTTKGPGEQYEVQGHVYGLGYELAGHTVNEVVLAFIPRNGKLKDIYLWSQPYDRERALQALSRVDNINQKLSAGKIPPDFPKGTPPSCTWCPFLDASKVEADEQGCPGVFR